MKIIVFLTTFIFLLNTFAIQVEKEGGIYHSINKPVTINWFALKEFKNKTGYAFGDIQLRSLISFINNASNYYSNNISANLKYIKTNMDASFTDLYGQYSVVMQVSPQRDLGDATIYCQGGNNYAYIGYGVNQRFPAWTYLVYRLYNPNDVHYEYIDSNFAYGTGLTKEQENQIAKIIRGIDGTLACDCSHTLYISNELENTISGDWNVVCQSSSNIHSYAAIFNSMWITAKPEACTYFIYALE